MQVIRFIRTVLGIGPSSTAGDDLLALGTVAVMNRALRLGGTLVLPSRVVFTLPAAELRLFETPPLREGLTRSLRKAVHARSLEELERLREIHGENVALVGDGALRVSLVQGPTRTAEASFDQDDATPARPSAAGRPSTSRPSTVRPARDITSVDRRADEATVPDITVTDVNTGISATDGADPDATVLDDALRLTLSSDGAAAGSAPITPGALRVGRAVGAALVVPLGKEGVSREALVVTRDGPSAIDVLVVNRNGAWVTRRSATGASAPRQRVESNERVSLQVGDRIDLDRSGAVSVSLERRGTDVQAPPHP